MSYQPVLKLLDALVILTSYLRQTTGLAWLFIDKLPLSLYVKWKEYKRDRDEHATISDFEKWIEVQAGEDDKHIDLAHF